MNLTLRFADCPVDDPVYDATVAFVFKEMKGEDNPVFSSFDEKSGGALTRSLEQGFLTGRPGESFLLPINKGLNSEKLLLKGLGAVSDFTLDAFFKRVREVAHSLEQMRGTDIALLMPSHHFFQEEYMSCVENVCILMTEAFFTKHKNDEAYHVNILVILEKNFRQEIEETILKLKAFFNSKLNYTIVFDRMDDAAPMVEEDGNLLNKSK